MRKIYFIILLFFVSEFPAFNFIFAQEHPISEYEKDYRKAEAYFNNLRKNPNVYFGIGAAKIEDGDIGAAIPIAKDRARAELAKSIKVKVSRVFESNLISQVTNIENHRRETITEKIKSKINTYTDQLLEDLSESQPFQNYPAPRNVSIAVFINKDSYKKNVEDDINGKKSMIRGIINNGLQKINKKHFYEGIEDLILANTYLNRFFDGLPIADDIQGDNNIRNVNSYIDGKITGFFSSLNFVSLSGELFYDVRGKLNQSPVILLQYSDESGKKIAVSKMPAFGSFIQNSGNIRNKMITDNYGKLKVEIKDIDPVSKSAKARITIDTSEFKGLDKIPNLTLPFIDITMNKMKTVALSVTFLNNGKNSRLLQMENKIKSQLLKSGMQVVTLKSVSETLSERDYKNIKNSNADYFIHLFIKTWDAKTVGGYNNMWAVKSSGTLSLYELPGIVLKNISQLPETQGYGTSESGAGFDGVGQLTKKIIQLVENNINLMR